MAQAKKAARSLDDLPRVHPKSRAELRKWLEKHHETSFGIWLVTYKKETGKPRVDYDEVVRELLCFGWVDSKVGKLDHERSLLLCTPRKPTSAWSATNKARIEQLERDGLMRPRGVELVRLAKETGLWSKLDAVELLEIPADLGARLDALPPARPTFERFPRSVKRGILEWIVQAKRPETRAARIEETATLAQRGERANQWKPKG
jgi:uncharacterized protein YdeI (YjbR/CyaY-like superfamily)